MKDLKNTGSRMPSLLKKRNELPVESLMTPLYSAAKTLPLLLGFLLLFSGFTYAQSTFNGEKADLTKVFKEDRSLAKEFKQEKDPSMAKYYKNQEREVKEEKQEVDATEDISPIIKSKFSSNFPKAQDAFWSVPEDQFVEVKFKDKGRSMMAFYGLFSNKLIGTGYFLNYENLPSNAISKIEKDYTGYTPVKVMYFDSNEDYDNDELASIYGYPIEKDSYFVQLMDKKSNKEVVLQVDTDGEVTFFTDQA